LPTAPAAGASRGRLKFLTKDKVWRSPAACGLLGGACVAAPSAAPSAVSGVKRPDGRGTGWGGRHGAAERIGFRPRSQPLGSPGSRPSPGCPPPCSRMLARLPSPACAVLLLRACALCCPRLRVGPAAVCTQPISGTTWSASPNSGLLLHPPATPRRAHALLPPRTPRRAAPMFSSHHVHTTYSVLFLPCGRRAIASGWALASTNAQEGKTRHLTRLHPLPPPHTHSQPPNT
jgi:hypothetical protein